MNAKFVLLVAAALLATHSLAVPAPAQQSAPATRPSATQGGRDAAQTADLSAEEILKRMVAAYADCKSYKDEGEATIVFIKPDGQSTDRRPFSTLFVRPKLFRFEFSAQSPPSTGPWHRLVVWADGAKIRSWWTLRRRVEEFESIEKALSGPTGVSGGSAATIPSLFIPDMEWGGGLKHLTNAKLLGTDQVDGAECYRIDATPPGPPDAPQTLWIDKQTFLIRKIATTGKFPHFSTQSTTTYKPQVNVSIPDERFKFEPSGN